jgi:hypothetical protein
MGKSISEFFIEKFLNGVLFSDGGCSYIWGIVKYGKKGNGLKNSW